MELNISELLEEKKSQKELDFVIQENGFYDGAEYIKLMQPINFTGILRKVQDDFILEGKIETVLELTCSRCIEKFSYKLNIMITEKFTNVYKENNEEDEIIFIDNNVIDITQIIHNNIILTLPIKRLCKKDCKGLCQQCGINLNKFKCQCKSHDIDPRLAKLKDVFFTD